MYNAIFQALQVLETATLPSLWEQQNSSIGMDIINPGGERPRFLTCGTSGSFLIRQGSFIPYEDMVNEAFGPVQSQLERNMTSSILRD